MAEEKKEEKVYVYPSKNPYGKRGRLGVGYVEYKHKDFKVYVPLPKITEGMTVAELEAAVQKDWGPHCDLNTVLTKFVRSVGNNMDNSWGLTIKGCEERGESPEAIADALQEAVKGYEVGAPREAKSAKDKEDAAKMRAAEEKAASLINPETGKPFTMEEILALAAKVSKK